MMSKRR